MDDSKVEFNSNWEMDRLIAQNDVAIGTGTTLLYTFASSLTPPSFEVQYSPNSSQYYQMGHGQLGGTYFDVHAFIDGTGIYVTSNVAGRARYYIWSDKVNY